MKYTLQEDALNVQEDVQISKNVQEAEKRDSTIGEHLRGDSTYMFIIVRL